MAKTCLCRAWMCARSTLDWSQSNNISCAICDIRGFQLQDFYLFLIEVWIVQRTVKDRLID